MNLAKKIYTYRKKLGYSQEEFAEKLGISRQAVSKWETGEATPELSKIPIMASLFGVTTDHLLSEEEPEQDIQIAVDPKITPPSDTPLPAQTPPRHNTHENDWIIGVVLAVIGAILIFFGSIGLLLLNVLTGTSIISNIQEQHEVIILEEMVPNRSPFFIESNQSDE